jgi:hypothetical protein
MTYHRGKRSCASAKLLHTCASTHHFAVWLVIKPLSSEYWRHDTQFVAHGNGGLGHAVAAAAELLHMQLAACGSLAYYAGRARTC